MDNEVGEILRDTLVAPVLKLKETHPEYQFTEKGYDTLIHGAMVKLVKWIQGRKKQNFFFDTVNDDLCDEIIPDWRQTCK